MTCCTDHLTDFSVLVSSSKATKTPKSGGGKKDPFGGRLVIGPLFLVIFDLLIIVGAVVAFLIPKKGKSDQFTLEPTGLPAEAPA